MDTDLSHSIRFRVVPTRCRRRRCSPVPQAPPGIGTEFQVNPIDDPGSACADTSPASSRPSARRPSRRWTNVALLLQTGLAAAALRRTGEVGERLRPRLEAELRDALAGKVLRGVALLASAS